MEDCEHFLNKINERKAILSSLEEQMERAGVSTKGDFQNQIDHELRNIRYYTFKHEECLKSKTPDQTKIFCYIIVSTKSKVNQNTGDLYKHFEKDRYHDTDQNQWKPFITKETIKDLLSEIEAKYGFNSIYLDDNIEDYHWINFDNEIQNSVAIIDLFSIDEINKQVIVKFDTDKAGVLLPLCRKLHDSLCSLATKLESNFRVIKAKSNLSIPCSLYASDVSGVDSFKLHLLRIFHHKFPIKNQSITGSPVRNLKIGFE